MFEKIPLTANAQTGTTAGTAGVPVQPYKVLAFQFVVEAAGATPTATWKIQGTVDPNEILDAAASWNDLGYITPASDTIATTALVSTAVGSTLIFLANPIARQYRRFRVVVSANTNITYHAEAHRVK